MKYAFRWRERAVRQLRAIPQPAALTILRALAPLGDDPRRLDANVKKLAGYEDRYRLRVGDYRVIYDVMDGQLVILVVGVGPGAVDTRGVARAVGATTPEEWPPMRITATPVTTHATATSSTTRSTGP